jgi:isopenicillin N synthase-like dioxygenase
VEVERSLAVSGLGAAQAIHGQVPVIDLSDSGAADAMWEAAQEPGFFVVTNHGISEEAIDEAFRLSRDFFNQSKEDKERQSPFEKSMNAGYEFFSQIRPSTGAPDQKESLQITAREGCMDGRWPSVPNFEERLKNFMVKSHDLGCRILSILEPKACPKLAQGTLAAAHRLWVEDGQCTLRLLHYPPVHDAGKLPANYWRAGPHTDWCCATLLFQQPGNEGLECAPNPKAMQDGAPWLKVDPVPGGIAVNIGDMLGRWSDGRLFANLHRVRMPTKEESSPPKSRYSMGFFMQADKHVRIECETCETITAGDYLLGRVRANFAK